MCDEGDYCNCIKSNIVSNIESNIVNEIKKPNEIFQNVEIGTFEIKHYDSIEYILTFDHTSLTIKFYTNYESKDYVLENKIQYDKISSYYHYICGNKLYFIKINYENEFYLIFPQSIEDNIFIEKQLSNIMKYINNKPQISKKEDNIHSYVGGVSCWIMTSYCDELRLFSDRDNNNDNEPTYFFVCITHFGIYFVGPMSKNATYSAWNPGGAKNATLYETFKLCLILKKKEI